MAIQSKMEKERGFADILHKYIPLPHPLPLVVDTPEFQHLRRVAQLGAVSFVYPSCEHSRYPHSLGVCHLALEYVKHLKQTSKLSGADTVSKADILAVGLAGLAHDLGHGPYSHAYDQLFIKHFHPESGWKHEQGSVDMLKHIFKKYPHIKKEFDRTFTDIDYQFVYELINPPKSLVDEQGNWLMKGRGTGKAYLWEIVSNPDSGFDVDKLEYMMRDSLMSTFAVSCDETIFERIKNNMQVFEKTDQYGNKMNHIFYRKKLILDIQRAVQSRAYLHHVVYRHKTVLVINNMILKIMIDCNDHYLLKGTNDTPVRLSEAYLDMEALQRTSDIAILDFVRNSTIPELEGARKLLEDIEFRRLPHCVYEYKTPTAPDPEEIDRICEIIHREGQNFNIRPAEFFYDVHNFNQGKGNESPLKFINFTDGNNFYYLSPFDIRNEIDVSYYITYFYMNGHYNEYEEIFNNIRKRMSQPRAQEAVNNVVVQNANLPRFGRDWMSLATIVLVISLLTAAWF